ncbi:GD23755 [Drosophila simulans]|uniref:GD23755 n=1 Tax=Drosophila simulans TaxID=7240 RepID=B4NUY9_DROSI|nr:GD23755 [Drosophila simulans]
MSAENLLVREAQLESFPDEIRSAENEKDVVSTSDIRGLVPYLDKIALCMPNYASRPVILCYISRMKHQNVGDTMVEIRTRFSVTKMRSVMWRFISSCHVCKLQGGRSIPPIMGPHSEDKLDVAGWPFNWTTLCHFW